MGTVAPCPRLRSRHAVITGLGADFLARLETKVPAADGTQAAGVELRTVGVIGFADHAVRCVLTVDAAGMRAAVLKGVALPHTYDPGSGQSWTRDRKTYLATDLVGRLATL